MNEVVLENNETIRDIDVEGNLAMRTVKWGIIGAGQIAIKFATALNSLDHTELTAIASRDLNKAENFATRFHIRKAYGSYEEIIRDPEIDVIYIGTPHTEHKAHAKLCMEAGKAVLCEKPFTLNYSEAKELVDLAKSCNVFLMEAMWTKFLPATRIVKQWINNKLIGEIKYINISFGFRTEYDPGSRLYNPSLGGGALLDVGVYPISYVIHLMERLPDMISSNAHLGQSKVDELNVITFQYNEGMLASISSAISAVTGNDAVIIGERGRIVIPNFWTAESAEVYDANGKLMDSFFHPFTSNGYVYEAEEVNRCIVEGKKQSDIIPLSDTLAIMKILDEIRANWGLVYPSERK
ncbi:MAG: oxidoreductase domain protein [Herbinix sp.]|jgi:predicted dehydrogenase|nr:oxidoreductase domain protein [Herbinix sp.]